VGLICKKRKYKKIYKLLFYFIQLVSHNYFDNIGLALIVENNSWSVVIKMDYKLTLMNLNVH
jgi:hypothetical protein